MEEAAELRKVFARAIQKARQKAGMSKTDLARALPADYSTVDSWEHETGTAVPSLIRAIKVTRVLGISLDELAFGRDECAEKLRQREIQLAELRGLLRGTPPTPIGRR